MANPASDKGELALDPGLIRQLPYSVEAEQAVLGALIMDPERFGEVSAVVKAEDFFIDKHQEIFAALFDLNNLNDSVDPVTLLNELEKKNVYTREAGNAYIRQLAENTPSISNVMDYARIVRDKSLLRSLVVVSEKIRDSALDQSKPVQEVIDSAEQMIFDLSRGFITQDFSHIKELIKEYYAVLNKLTTDKDATRGIPTNYSGLDRILVGMAPGDLIIIGGRPGMGKTSLAINIAVNVAKYSKKAVAVFSLEMSKLQLVERMLSSEGRVDGRKLHTGDVEEEDFNAIARAAVGLSNTDIYLDEAGGITVMQMRSKLRRLENLGLVVIDYLQLMHSDNSRLRENRVNEIGDITRNLKLMAKDLGVPIILCTQLSRSPEKRTGGNESKKPQLSDLRDSGNIEQDADVVLMLYREGYYNEDDPEAKNRADCLVAKNRHGETGTVHLAWECQYTRFTDVEKRYEET
ncbi:MAG: replicative DNA helicase [Clostridia bacterium]|nr:replicative DNA helicase [Clostridia bacterium]